MTQEERLDDLVRRFKEDSGEYRNLRVGEAPEEKRRILRSLMNIRMPRKLDTCDRLLSAFTLFENNDIVF